MTSFYRDDQPASRDGVVARIGCGCNGGPGRHRRGRLYDHLNSILIQLESSNFYRRTSKAAEFITEHLPLFYNSQLSEQYLHRMVGGSPGSSADPTAASTQVLNRVSGKDCDVGRNVLSGEHSASRHERALSGHGVPSS